jgi:hypothetical protein
MYVPFPSESFMILIFPKVMMVGFSLVAPLKLASRLFSLV